MCIRDRPKLDASPTSKTYWCSLINVRDGCLANILTLLMLFWLNTGSPAAVVLNPNTNSLLPNTSRIKNDPLYSVVVNPSVNIISLSV